MAEIRFIFLQFCLIFAFVAIVRAQGGLNDKDAQSSRLKGSFQGVKREEGGKAPQGADTIGQAPPLPLRLSEEPACADFVKKYCRNANPSTMNNLAALDCLHNNVPKEEELDERCQHVIWTHKKKMTSDVRFDSAAGAVCGVDLKRISECNSLSDRTGLKIPCLIENMDNVTQPQCKDFLNRMEAIVFSDYRLVYKFVESCNDDIIKRGCGRLEDDEAQKSIHNQGDTITCLSRSVGLLAADCKKQILRVAELQGSDYHNDRQVFFACQDDRERLCANVPSGNGRVYKCLADHKFDQQMSKGCRDKLTVRQVLQRADFKVNRGLTVACRSHIMSERCVDGLQRVSNIGLQEVRLSTILLCLENATKAGRKLDPECVAELVSVRKSLMSDYQLNPEIISGCGIEIRDFCNNGIERGGRTIHCLMSNARGLGKRNTQPKTFSAQCRTALGLLMKEVNVRENFQIDPVLQRACGSIVALKCSDVQSGQGKVIDCLMNLVDKKNIMTDECADKLMETQYFVSRDFDLSPGFFKMCSPAINSVCHVSADGIKEDKQSEVLLCLYRSRLDSRVKGPCADAVTRVMLDRAKSVDLEPAVEAACMEDLSRLCSEKTEKNEEMDCLEDNLEDLDEECKKQVKNYIEEEDELPEVNQIFMKACEPILKDQCKDALSGGKDADGDSLMTCLIKYKGSSDMPAKCRAGIEHHQVVTLKDFSLSHEFKESCKNEVQEHCSKVKTKFEVVSCLSDIIRNETFRDQPSSILNPKCKRQLKFELLQRSDSIQLDPELKLQCEEDVKDHCSNVSPGKAGIINCLRSNQQKLKPQCRMFVFKRERDEAMDPTTDFALMMKCKRMIKKYCDNEASQPADLFPCLRKHKDEEVFDKGCYRVVVARQRLRAHDVRLNPELMKDCNEDIRKFCPMEFEAAKNSDVEVEGKVIGCLRAQFAKQSSKKVLSDSCTEHIQDIIKESAVDYVQDVALAKACRAEISQGCSEAVAVDRQDPDRGAVEECLRKLMIKSVTSGNNEKSALCWKEVARVLVEDKADIHVDPLLFRACSNDLLHVCKDVSRGEGRQMSCMVDALNDKKVRLRPECRKALDDRVRLWDKAMQAAPPESLSEMANQVSISPARNYLMTVFVVIVGVIFIGGLFCGRVTKRVASLSDDSRRERQEYEEIQG